MSKRTKSANNLSKVLESKLKKAKCSSDDSDSDSSEDTSESLSLSSSDEKSKSKSSSKKSKQSKKKKKSKSSSKKKKKKYSSCSESDSDVKNKKSKKKKKKHSKEKDKDKDDKEALHRKLKLLNTKPSVGDVLSAKRKSSIEVGAAASKKAKLDKSSDKSKNLEQTDINEAILGAIEKEMTTNASQTISEILDDILGSERVKINEKKLLEDSLKNITIKKEKEDDSSAIKIKKEKVDKIDNSQKESLSSSNKIKILPVKLNRSRREPENSDSVSIKSEKDDSVTKISNGEENKRAVIEQDKSDEKNESRDGDKRDDNVEEKDMEDKEEDVPLPAVADVFVEDLLASQAAAELVKTNTEKPQKPGKITIGNLKQPSVFKQVEDAEKKRRSKYEDGEITPSELEDDDSKVEGADKAEKTRKDKKKKRSTKHRKYRERERSRTRSPDRSSKGSSRRHSSASSRSRHRRRGSRSRSRDRRRSRESERDRARDRDRARERDRRSRRQRSKRSRSISLSLSPELRRQSKSPIDSSSKIDKKKLLEIARRNAASMMAEGGGALAKKFDWRMAGKSVNELTDFCKSLSRKGEEGEESSESVSSAESVEAPFHHPFEIKTRPDHIVMNIKNAQALKTKSFQEKSVEQSKQLSLQFPVSSGSQHRRTESEWVPVTPAGQPEASTLNFSAVAIPGAPPLETAMAARAILPVPAPAPVAAPLAIAPAPAAPQPPAPPPVFSEPDPDVRNMDIGSVVSQRLRAMRRLAENPHDAEAQTQMYHAQRKMQAWAESKQMPGQFTGSTEVRVLTPQELAAGSQAWARKEQFEAAAPVRGGMGMHLLQKMGWQPGQGLGKNMEGSLEPLQMDIKLDKRGLVAKEELPQQRKNPFVYRRGGMGGAAPMSMGRGGPPPGPRPPMQMSLDGKHPVSLLHEFCMRRKLGVPQYTQVSEEGPPHKKTFVFKEILPLILATRQPRKSACIAENLLALSRGEPLPHALDQMENETVHNHARSPLAGVVDNYETFNDCDNAFDNPNRDNSTENYLPSSNQDESNDIFREFSRGPRENDRYHFYKNNRTRPKPGSDSFPNHPVFAGSNPQSFPFNSSFQSLPNSFNNKTNTQFNSSSLPHSSNANKTNTSLNVRNENNVSSHSVGQKNSSTGEHIPPDGTMAVSDFPRAPGGKLPNQPEDDVTSPAPRSSRRQQVRALYCARNRTGLDTLLKAIMSRPSLSEDDLLAISEIYEARKCIALGTTLFEDMKVVARRDGGNVQGEKPDPCVGESPPKSPAAPPPVNATNSGNAKKTDIGNRRNGGNHVRAGGEPRFEPRGNQREGARNEWAWNRDDRNGHLFGNHATDGRNHADPSRLDWRSKAPLSPPRNARKRKPPAQSNVENRLNRSPSPRLKNRSPSPQNIGQGPNTSPPYDNRQRINMPHHLYNNRYSSNRSISPAYDSRHGPNRSMSPTFDNRHDPNRSASPPYDTRHIPDMLPLHYGHCANRPPSPRYDIRHGPNRSHSPRYDIRHDRLPSPPYESRHRTSRSPSPHSPGKMHEIRGLCRPAHQPPRSPSRLNSLDAGSVEPDRAPGAHDKSLETSAAAAALVNLENCAPSSLESGEIESGELTEDDEDKFSISEAAHSPKKQPIGGHHSTRERSDKRDSGRTRGKDVESRSKKSRSKGAHRRNVVGEYKPPDVDRWLETNFNATPAAVELKDKAKLQAKDSKAQTSGDKSCPVEVWKNGECSDGQRNECATQSSQVPLTKAKEVEKISVNSLKKETVETKTGAETSKDQEDKDVSDAKPADAVKTKDVCAVPSEESCTQSNNTIVTPEPNNAKTEEPSTSDTSQEPGSKVNPSESQQDANKSEKTTAGSPSDITSPPNTAKKSSIFNRLDSPPAASESNKNSEQPVASAATRTTDTSRYGNYHSEGEISLSDEDSIYSTSHLIPNLAEMMLQEMTPLMEVKVPVPDNVTFSPGRYADPAPASYREVPPGYAERGYRSVSPGRYSPPRRRSNVSPGRTRSSSSEQGRSSPPRRRTHRASPAPGYSPPSSPERVVRRAPTPEEVDLRTLLQTLQAPGLPRPDDLEPVLCAVHEAPREENEECGVQREDYRGLARDFIRESRDYVPREDYERDIPHEDYEREIPENYERDIPEDYEHEERYENDGHSPRHAREYRRYSATDDHRSDDYRRPGDHRGYDDGHSSDRYLSDHRVSDHQNDHSRPMRRRADAHRQEMSEGRAGKGAAPARPGQACDTTERELFNPDELFESSTGDLYNPTGGAGHRGASHYTGQRGHTGSYRGHSRGGFRGQRGNIRRGRASRFRRSMRNPY